MPGTGPIAVCYVAADAGWAACLMTDLASHGLEVRDATGADRAQLLARARGVLIVESRFAGYGRPTPGELAPLNERGCPIVVGRRNPTIVGRDDYPGRRGLFDLWGDRYQPAPAKARRVADNGWVLTLQSFGAMASTVPSQFLFLSYRSDPDGPFVSRLREALALDGYATWSYRASQHIEDVDDAIRLRMALLIESCDAVIAVATPHWTSVWTQLELTIARQCHKVVMLVRPAGARTIRPKQLAGYPMETLPETGRRLPRTVAALQAAGIQPILAAAHEPGR